MNLAIEQLTLDRLQDINRCDGTFQVTGRLILSAQAGMIHYSVEEVPSYEKRYPADPFEPASYIENPDKAIYLAYLNGQVAGQLRLCRYWNRYAYIEDIVVDTSARRNGVGRALMAQAVAWGLSSGCAGIMLETQDNNVAACKLYESCGLKLAGFDTCLYRGIEAVSRETALYWYLLF